MLNMSIGNIKKLIFVTVTVTVECYVCFSGVLFFTFVKAHVHCT
jgi:hypothetical protein